MILKISLPIPIILLVLWFCFNYITEIYVIKHSTGKYFDIFISLVIMGVSIFFLLFEIHISYKYYISLRIIPIVFSLFWSFCFYLNSFKLSKLQFIWQADISHIILIGPIVATIFVYLVFIVILNTHNKLYRIRNFNNYFPYSKYIIKVSTTLFIVGFLIFVYEIKTYGIVPLLASNISEARTEYALPIFHVMSDVFVHIGFYTSAYFLFNKRYKMAGISIVVSTYFYFLLSFSRSGLISITIYLIFLQIILGNITIRKIIQSCMPFISYIVYILIPR